MKSYIILLLLAVTVTSCSKVIEKDPLDKIVIEPMKLNAVDFGNLVDGQESVYEGYYYSCDSLEDVTVSNNIIYLGVVNKENKWFFTESRKMDGVKTVMTEYEVIPSENMLRIPERESSSLFYFYDSDKFDLSPLELLDIEQTECVFSDGQDTFDGDAIGFTENFDFRGLTYDGKLALSCIPTILDGDAYLIHDTRQLIMSHRIFVSEFWGEVTTSVSGFKLQD